LENDVPASSQTPTKPDAGPNELSLDERLIRALQEDGRLTNMALSRRFGVSEALVRQRLKRLFEGREIRAIAVADLRTMGLDTIAFVRVAAVGGAVERVQRKLRALSEVTAIYLTTGAFNVCAWVVAPNTQALSLWMDEHLRCDADIRKLDMRLVVSAYRYEGLSGFIVEDA